jgi:hypothetical protein
MKHYLCGLLVGLLAACNSTAPPKELPVKDSPIIAPVAVVKDTAYAPRFPADSNTIVGDFNGDGRTDTAFVVRTKEGYGNPVEDGVPDEYAIQFTDTLLHSVNINCCEARLFNEGDLDSDGADEIGVFKAPENGNVYFMSVWTFRDQRWEEFMESFAVPTGGDDLSDKEVQQKVFLENGIVYYLDVDLELGYKPIKKKAVLR